MNSAPLSLWRGDTLVTVMPARRPHGALSVSPGETAISAAIDVALASHPGVMRREIMSKARHRRVVHARQEVMWLLRSMTWDDGAPRYSLPGIARALGIADHTTVLHGVRAHERRMLEEQARAAA